jgi:hypothetical protein
MNDITKLSDTIKPKSDQLNADDLLANAITVEITAVERGNNEQPIRVRISGGFQPYYPCKSMRRVMIAAWGDDGRQWIGKRLELYADPEVAFGGVKVGGIRIRKMSGIDGPQTFMLTATRGKKSAFKVHPLATAAEPTASPFWPQDKFTAKLATIADKLKSGERTEQQAVEWFEKTAPLTSAQKLEIAGTIQPAAPDDGQF